MGFLFLHSRKSYKVRSQTIFHNVYFKSLVSHLRKPRSKVMEWLKGLPRWRLHAQPRTLEDAETPLATSQSLAQCPRRHSSVLRAPRTGVRGGTELPSSAESLPLAKSAVGWSWYSCSCRLLFLRERFSSWDTLPVSTNHFWTHTHTHFQQIID